MWWSDLHSRMCNTAFEQVFGVAKAGAMAFVRCLDPEVGAQLARDRGFAPQGWQVYRVADRGDPSARTVTADHAVELREAKTEAVLLLVDVGKAGAGMDRIYSAARGVQEAELFSQLLRLTAREIRQAMGNDAATRAEQALRRVRRLRQRRSLSYWSQFDSLVRTAHFRRDPGAFLYLLGLWPAKEEPQADWQQVLDLAVVFVERLLGPTAAGLTPAQRIDSLKLLDPSETQLRELEQFLRSAASKPLFTALQDLSEQEHLWIHALRVQSAALDIVGIELLPWRTRNGRLVKWSGLTEDPDSNEPPELVLDPQAEQTGNYSKLEVRWRARPETLARGAVTYRVAVVTGMDEELAMQEVPHRGKKQESCRFTNDDFSLLGEHALVAAKVVISVIGRNDIEPQETEEFTIRYGDVPERSARGIGKPVRTFSEGLVELPTRQDAIAACSAPSAFRPAPRGFLLLRTPTRGKSFPVLRPALLEEAEGQWIRAQGAVGRWRVRVRTSGTRVGEPEFVRFECPATAEPSVTSSWERVLAASRRLAERFQQYGGGVGQVYDETVKGFDTVVKEYVLAWAALLELEESDPLWALAHTVEVQSLSGRTLGLIVLPSHPLRVAWHVAYDNLVLHTRFELERQPREIQREFRLLIGSMFPPFLPGLEPGRAFVFADTLGFHTVGMVADSDKEPKAAIAILGRALGEADAGDAPPTVGMQSAAVLGREIQKYVECHDPAPVLRVHALRAGDGFTVARALGTVRLGSTNSSEEIQEGEEAERPCFLLELYPSREQRAVASRYLAEAQEKRRRWAGVLPEEDRWMLDSVSLPGGIHRPWLRWARKESEHPESAAHLAIAFDTFESRVVVESEPHDEKPFFAYGLLSFFHRQYSDQPLPCWKSAVFPSSIGEKHPSERGHSERLVRLQEVLLRCVARHLGNRDGLPVVRTQISAEKAESLRTLHRLCDWVLTLDRNAGVEYFDSPQTNPDIYDAYIIDCVPEREDLGCLQLITSTSNLEEVCNLLNGVLEQMGLARSRRTAEFLLHHLKALSGRLAILLTGQQPPAAELIALALSHASCAQAGSEDPHWTPLNKGFFVPIDDVADLLPPFATDDGPQGTTGTLLYVTTVPRRGLSLQFVQVCYRRLLRTARDADLVDQLAAALRSLREQWNDYDANPQVPDVF